MEKFVGRKNEMKILMDFSKMKDRNLVAIIGRRGVGKSRLNDEFKEKLLKEDFFLIDFKGNNKMTRNAQINRAKEILENKFNIEITKELKTWFSFFNEFKKLLLDFVKEDSRKIIVLIDEFAWLHNNASGFVDEFASFYDELMRLNILFVITGSAVSWMNKNVIKSKGGLHAKVHKTIKLEPFNLKEVKEFLLEKNPSFSNYEIIEYYFYTGGVARYLEKIKVNESLKQNIKYIYENGSNVNNSEFEEMFSSIFEGKTKIHQQIIYCFKDKNSFTKKEIEKKLLEKNQKFSHGLILSAIEDLIVSGILLEKQHYGKIKRDANYYLADLFCYFYIKSFQGNQFDEKQLNNQQLKGIAFEILINQNIDLLIQHIGKNGFSYKVYSWKNKESQIDLIIDFGNEQFSLLEIKYHNLPLEINNKITENILLKKQEFLNSIPRKKKEMDIYIISLSGTKNKDGRLYYQDVKVEDLL